MLRLVETEAYLGAADAASHARGGHRSARNESMYLAGGHAYVYFVYGMHWCLNVVCAERDVPHAVLLRAGEAVEGARAHGGPARAPAARRGPRELAGGPARLCQALGVDRALDGADLRRGALRLTAGEPLEPAAIGVSARVGVDYAGAAARWPLRFFVARQRRGLAAAAPRGSAGAAPAPVAGAVHVADLDREPDRLPRQALARTRARAPPARRRRPPPSPRRCAPRGCGPRPRRSRARRRRRRRRRCRGGSPGS